MFWPLSFLMKLITHERHLNLHCLAAMSAKDTGITVGLTAILRWYNINKETYHFFPRLHQILNLTSNPCVVFFFFLINQIKGMEWVVNVVVMKQFLDATTRCSDMSSYYIENSRVARLANLWMNIYKQGGTSVRTRTQLPMTEGGVKQVSPTRDQVMP